MPDLPIPFLNPPPVLPTRLPDAAPTLASNFVMPPTLPQFSAPPLPNIVPAPTQLGTDMAERNRLISTGDGISQIHNPFLHGLARTGDVLASVFAPNLAQFIPGTSLHHNMLVGEANRNVQQDQQSQLDAASLAQSQATTRLTTDKAQEAETPAGPDYQYVDGPNGTKTAILKGTTTGSPVTGPDGKPIIGDAPVVPPETAAYQALVAKGVAPLDAFAQLNQARNTKDASIQQQFLDGYRKAHPGVSDTDAIAATLRATVVAPKIEVHNATVAPAGSGSTGTWQPGYDAQKNPIMFNSKTGEVRPMDGSFTKNTVGNAKIGADEQKRADFAQNMGENINGIEDILNRRPELFGPLAGRLTDLKTTIGTNDPDIAKLNALEHQLAMVTQGVHGMRSSQGLEGAAKSLINAHRNGATATRTALEAARNSTTTFLQDSATPGQARVSPSPTTAGGGIQIHRDAQGNIVGVE